MKAKKVWAIVALILLILIYKLFNGAGTSKVRARPQVSVKVSQVTESKIHTVLEFIGTAVSNESVDITSSVAQKVTKINFSDCDFVKKGDVLVQQNIDKQLAIKKQAEINLQEQQRELTRISALKKRNVIAAKEYDSQTTKVQDAQAKLAEVEEEIKERTIVAPFDGMLGIRKISVGAMLSPGMVITTIDDIKKIKVDFSVPEKYLPLITNGCKIEATSIALPGKKFHGTVQAISPRISATSRSISVRGIIDNDDYLLRSGMMLNVIIEMQDRNAIQVSESAILNVGEKHYVYVVDSENRAKQREIEIGERSDHLVEVTKGLTSSDTVIVDGVVKISDGDVVKISKDSENTDEVK
ncbi:MAG: efflux RND transporter periplasmic adaptor subunit [Alphaproteobacteria bacterium]|nr:efflux RND transporter periplasmic adaptor subunit [Alphaproteobacteria bacterium]